MRRFRKILRPVPVLALIATVQMALALGQSHALIHAQQHAAGHLHRATASGRISQQRTPLALVCRTIVQHKGCNETPVRDDHIDCALCWAAAAAGAAGLPSQALPEPMRQPVAVATDAYDTVISLAAIKTAFDARGPPLI